MKYKELIINHIKESGFKDIIFDVTEYYNRINKEDEIGTEPIIGEYFCLVNNILLNKGELKFDILFRLGDHEQEFLENFLNNEDLEVSISNDFNKKVDLTARFTLDVRGG
jgi:hypothetical protein